MPEFIYDIPLRQLAIYTSLAAVAAFILGLIVLKPVLRLLFGTSANFNETLGVSTSAFNLFYGLLLGLLTVSAYQNSETVKQGILAEATALSQLYTSTESYPEPINSELSAMLRDYVLFTIYRDWPAHRKGQFLDGGANRAGALWQKLSSFEPKSEGQSVLHTAVVGAFQQFAAARQQRITGTQIEIPPVLWYAVLLGALMNLILLILVKLRPRPHLLLGSISAFFLGVILFVIVALDAPLRGVNGITPDPFLLLWEREMALDEGFG
jgi:hypothetical protein